MSRASVACRNPNCATPRNGTIRLLWQSSRAETEPYVWWRVALTEGLAAHLAGGGDRTGSRSRRVACVGRLPQPKLRYTPKKLFDFISAHPFIGDDTLLRYTPKSYSILFSHIPSSGTMPYCATPRKELFVCHGRAPERRLSRTAPRSERRSGPLPRIPLSGRASRAVRGASERM